jgi:hypothetical protein
VCQLWRSAKRGLLLSLCLQLRQQSLTIGKAVWMSLRHTSVTCALSGAGGAEGAKQPLAFTCQQAHLLFVLTLALSRRSSGLVFVFVSAQ